MGNHERPATRAGRNTTDQRGAKAVSRQISQFGVDCDTSDAQTYINQYLDDFQKIAKFLEFCKASVTDPGYLRSVYGRMRWFFSVQNQSSMKAQEREACNWPEKARVSIKRGEFRESRYRALGPVILSQAWEAISGKVQRLGRESLETVIGPRAPRPRLAA